MAKIGDSFNWFKGQSCCAKIFLILGVVVTAVGAVGYFVWYWMWFSHYDRFYKEENPITGHKAYLDVPSNAKIILQCILAGCILAVIVIVAIIIAFFMWFCVSNGLIWKIVMLVAVAGSLGAVICGFILAAKTNPDIVEGTALEDDDAPGCLYLAAYDLVESLGKDEDYSMWCKDSMGRNLSMCLILIVGIILDFIGFCVAK